MPTLITSNGSARFSIRRPSSTTNGFISTVDQSIKDQLQELNALLCKSILALDVNLNDKLLLKKPLTPKQGPGKWAENSLLADFNAAPEAADKISISDYIEENPDLSKLKFAFLRHLSNVRLSLDFNTRAVLDDQYAAIIDYLIAYAFYIGKRQEIDGLTDFIFNDINGARSISTYASISAARAMITQEQLVVRDYTNDKSAIVDNLKAANLLLSSLSFKTKAREIIDNFRFNAVEADLIDKAVKAGIVTVSPQIKPILIKQIKQSPIPVTDSNVNYFLPLLISQIQSSTYTSDTSELSIEESDKDFDVIFLEDDIGLMQISKSAVKCAAQLYYGMVLGDELDVFNVVNYFTHKYLIRGGIEIQDRRLREDLQMYVFSNRFTDLKTKKTVDRTRPAERHMFYRQVFNAGMSQITDDVIVNKEFTRLWKVLILESANYLERARESFYPESYVSKQNVMQAVEDLQYNLSTHCTGMANVITPLIYAELDFVIRRIFMHPEILRQIVPQGGTWWRVVETLYMGMKNIRPRATVLYNKAKLGHATIRSIAEYNPSSFENDTHFSAFISNIDALITTQSILQEALTDDLKRDQIDEHEDDLGQNGWQQGMPEVTQGVAPHSDSEWDF